MYFHPSPYLLAAVPTSRFLLPTAFSLTVRAISRAVCDMEDSTLVSSDVLALPLRAVVISPYFCVYSFWVLTSEE